VYEDEGEGGYGEEEGEEEYEEEDEERGAERAPAGSRR
jgi:hypothetical protein